MKALRVQVDLRHLGLRDGPPGRIPAAIEATGDRQAFGRGGPGNEVHHRLVAEGLATPVRRDEGKQPVLDLIPLARAGWEMVDHDGEVRVVGEPLEFHFPDAQTPAVAAAGVRGDQDLGRVRIEVAAFVMPPAANRRDREGAVVGRFTIQAAQESARSVSKESYQS